MTTTRATETFRRFRRLRSSEAMRSLVRETRLSPAGFVYPLFVTPGEGVRTEIVSMPGQYQLSIDQAVREAEEVVSLGIGGVLIFGLPSAKDEAGSEAYDPEGIAQRAVRALKAAQPDLLVITDVCLCEYTSHGHCGVVEGSRVVNDRTLELLTRTALSHARAGADVVAPSDMMDGRVGAIRQGLEQDGFEEVVILSYAAKYASAFYGPFRQAADSSPQFGDRRSYQMDPANVEEALVEVGMDLDQGADIVMVKPALAYLDVIWRVKDTYGVPVAAYNVSGEYSMLHAAAEQGWIEREAALLEVLTSIKRAGADIILTYHAREAARLLR